MAQKKILVDTNSYLRLAKDVHPFLFQTFGDENYCLYIIPELNDELARSTRLQSKFHWIDQAEYQENRQAFPTVGKKQAKQIENAYSVIWEHVVNEFPGPSPVDVKYLAYADVLGIKVVTDDADMTELAREFEIPVISSLELMKVMVESDHITMEKVRSIVNFWAYSDDLPNRNFRTDYEQIFGEPFE
ncbi:DNA-binding protein [Vibrio campbellii]|uniref:DNA-binding protein n=1 Tax=Vibrio campbellii TaxID=680 RepID=UPI003C12DB5F